MGGLPVEGVEELERVVLVKLDLSLEALLLLRVVEALDVLGRDDDAHVVLVSFVEGLAHSSAVVVVHSSVLHQLDSALLNHSACLRSGVHHNHGLVLVLVLDADGCLDGVVVGGDVLVGGEVPGCSVVESSLHHLEPVAVGGEIVVVVDVKGLEVDGHFLALIAQRNVVEDDIILESQQVRNELDLDCSGGSVGDVKILQGNGLGLVSLNKGNAAQRCVFEGIVSIVLGSEDVHTTLLAIILERIVVSQLEGNVEDLVGVFVSKFEFLSVFGGGSQILQFHFVVFDELVISSLLNELVLGRDFEELDRVGGEEGVDVKLAVLANGVVVLHSPRADDGAVGFFELLLLGVEGIGCVVGAVGNVDLDMVGVSEGGIVDCDQHVFVEIVGNGAVEIGRVFPEALLPAVFALDPGVTAHLLGKQL